MGPTLAVPERPVDESAAVVFEISPGPSSDPNRSSVQARDLRRGSSVVINIPTAMSASGSAHGADLFRTRNFHNEIEDSIQTALIDHGLVVKDRLKFEAILRDLRDVGSNWPPLDTWNTRRYADPAVEAAMDDLAAALDRGDLSSAEYAEQVFRYRSRLGMGLQVGENRAEDEIADTADLIRAAHVSENRADYILQINALRSRTRPIRDPLFSYPTFRAFADEHEAVRAKYADPRHADFRCDAVEATISAKLIAVSSGDVIWIGHHAVTELDDKKIEIEVGYRRGVDNYASIVAFVDRNNRIDERVRRYGHDVTLPPFSYSTQVAAPRILSATKCDAAGRTESEIDEIGRELANRAVAELIRTIRVAE